MSLVLRGHRIAFSYAAKARDVRTFDSKAEGARKTRTLTGVMQLLGLLPAIKSSANPIRAQFVMHKLARLTTPLWLAMFVLAGFGVTAILAARYPLPILVLVVGTTAAVAAVPALRRLALHVASWVISLQLATVRAIRNGLRGKWSVWQGSAK